MPGKAPRTADVADLLVALPSRGSSLGKPPMRHDRRARRMPGMPLRLLLAIVAILLIPAATASADSIVFVKDANVWVASPDGSNQRQLTRDGTADHPYRSPSQADDGTVAASY